ncbi:MAG: DUF4381 domain-containing protein [Shewanella sp.]
MDPERVNSAIVTPVIANSQTTMAQSSTAANPAALQLQDIIPPEPIGAWPWAIGYWLLLALVISLITLLVIGLKKRARDFAPKKAAKQLLNQQDKQAPAYVSEVNSLLKRTAITYLGREAIAPLDGEAWATWLDSYLPEHQRQRIGPLLAKRHQATPLTLDEANELHALAQTWLGCKTKLSLPAQANPKTQANTQTLAHAQSTGTQEAQC